MAAHLFEMSRCSKCKLDKKEGLVGCEGICDKWFHYSCIGMNNLEFGLLSKNTNMFYLCDACKKKCDFRGACSAKDYTNNLRTVNEAISKMNVIVENTLECKMDEFTSSFKKLKSEMAQLIVSELETIIKVNVSDHISPRIDELRPKIDHMSSLMVDNNEQKTSYSTIAKKQPSFVIMPKNKQDLATTKNDMIKNINPVDSNINISKIKNIRNGGLVISCNNSDECDKFKELANTKLNKDYTIKEVPALNPRFKVVGISEKLSNEELINYVKSQNKNVISENSILKIIQLMPLKKNNKIYQAVIQSDIATYNKVIEYGKLFIGYDYCSIYDAIEMRRCFKCCGYHHISNQCTINVFICPVCAQNHKLEDCPRTGTQHCINCHNYNKQSNVPVNVNHAAWDRSCHVYNITLQKFRNNIISPQ